MNKKIYEYTAVLNGEEVKAEYCFSNRYGSSYCVVDGYRYNDIPYSAKILGVNQFDSLPFLNIVTFIMLIITFYLLIKTFFFER